MPDASFKKRCKATSSPVSFPEEGASQAQNVVKEELIVEKKDRRKNKRCFFKYS
jgi:hypothetical protein